MTTATLSTAFAEFAAATTFEQLPAAAVDKAKACILHNVVAGILGTAAPIGRSTGELMQRMEPAADGATLMLNGARVTAGAAAFANSAAVNATNQCDSYFMLTHPGPIIIPAVLAAAEWHQVPGPELLAGVVTGYEVQCRLARDLIPTTQANGYRSAPVYGVIGGAVAVARMLHADATNVERALALAATAASGTSECARVGGNEHHFHEPHAARTAVLAAQLAPLVGETSRTSLEGRAGFFNAFVGSHQPAITHAFRAVAPYDQDAVTRDLGGDFWFRDVTFKPYPTPGFNNPVIKLMSRIVAGGNVDRDDIEKITLTLNHLETSYPSPEFPREELRERRYGTTPHVVALTLLNGDYPRTGQWFEHGLGRGQPGEVGLTAEVQALMDRVVIQSTEDRGYFSPKAEITFRDGRVLSDELDGTEFRWDFAQTCGSFMELVPALASGEDGAAQLIAAVEGLAHGTTTARDVVVACTRLQPTSGR